MAVLLFHFGVPGLGGGFVGVDVFFVISGFLISSIIIEELSETGSFSFKSFYMRRLRRILPALLATLVATAAGAILLLPPAELVSFGKSLAASAVSLSNIQFWSESGYFDAASQSKPLLHTWSLSVEEQFYLFWPALLYFGYRLAGRRGLLWSVVISGILSFAANYWAISNQRIGFASDLFFLTHYRVFEFAIGAAGYYLIHKMPRGQLVQNGAFLFGLAMVGYSIVTLVEGDVFPYINAIFPCVGTLLLIVAAGSSWSAMLLGNRLTVWIGRLSYALYLVHWPLAVFLSICLPTLSWPVRTILLLVSSFIGAATLHYLVERRFRHAASVSAGRKIMFGAVATAALSLVIGGVMAASDGMTWRYRYFTPGALVDRAGALPSPAHDTSAPVLEAPSVPSGEESAVGELSDGQTAQSADEKSKAEELELFRPLGASEIEAGKSRRFERLAGACRIDALDDPTRCFMGREKQVLIFGNSHEPDAFNAFDEIYGGNQAVNLINFGTVNDCQLVLGEKSISSRTLELGCKQRFSILDSDQFIGGLDIVVYNTHQGFDPVAVDLWKILGILKERNPDIHIIAIGSYLQTSVECATLYNQHRSYEACRHPDFVNYINVEERKKSPIPEVHSLSYLYVSKYELLCGGGDLSRCEITADGAPAFYDQHHLSLPFARYMGRKFAAQFGPQLAEMGIPVR